MEITDERASHWFDWNIHTAGRYPLLLIKHGWLHIQKFYSNDGAKSEVYYLGKEHVARAKRAPPPPETRNSQPAVKAQPRAAG